MDEDVQRLLKKRNYERALERLLDLYQTKVFRMAVMMLGNSGTAEEVTQDIFLKLWQALPAYDGRASPSTWLYTIARNTCRTALRSQSYRKTAPLDELNEPAARDIRPVSLEMEQWLGCLPQEQREAIMLFYWQEKSVEDVAQMLDLPQGTVKSHLHRARRTLGQLIREE